MFKESYLFKKYTILLDIGKDMSFTKNNQVPINCRVLIDDTKIRDVLGFAVKVKGQITLKFVISKIKSEEEFLVTNVVLNNYIVLHVKQIIVNED